MKKNLYLFLEYFKLHCTNNKQLNKWAFLPGRDFGGISCLHPHFKMLFFRAKFNTNSVQLFAIQAKKWPEPRATEMLTFDLIQDSVIYWNSEKQAEKYILNMRTVFKVLKIVCHSNNASYEEASSGRSGLKYRKMKVSTSLWPWKSSVQTRLWD